MLPFTALSALSLTHSLLPLPRLPQARLSASPGLGVNVAPGAGSSAPASPPCGWGWNRLGHGGVLLRRALSKSVDSQNHHLLGLCIRACLSWGRLTHVHGIGFSLLLRICPTGEASNIP